eukprot:TRINITY_DN61803_c0_g1_i1.p1 TRINITY_DN61803_c0_g1~~TRINITY_DN61803_c0_g1_i1.p1  ORF type:complete len:761 (-),score=125.87 TRINITY_DN61803_c0_g1_i1:205-2388(-)
MPARRKTHEGLVRATFRQQLTAVLESSSFDVVIAIIIVLNSVLVGVEQSLRNQGKGEEICQMIEHFFLSTYVAELLLRVYVKGLVCLKDPWVAFDASLVAIGISSSWIIMPIVGDSEIAREIGLLMVLRIARLLRLARALRMLASFRDLWMLVRSLLNSATTMLHVMVLLLIILYTFSCLSMEIITDNSRMSRMEPEYVEFQEVVSTHFADLPQTLLTLTQFITLDSLGEIYRPLVKADWKLSIFFMALILVVSIVAMNIVTAVIVNSAVEQAMEDKDLRKAQDQLRKKRMLRDLQSLFDRLDEDNSGVLTRDEVAYMDPEDQELLSSLSGSCDPTELFDSLDVNGSGGVRVEEFIDGVWQNAISSAPVEIKRIDKQMSLLRKEISSDRLWTRKVLVDINRRVSNVMIVRSQANVPLQAEAFPISNKDVCGGTETEDIKTAISDICSGYINLSDVDEARKEKATEATPGARCEMALARDEVEAADGQAVSSESCSAVAEGVVFSGRRVEEAEGQVEVEYNPAAAESKASAAKGEDATVMSAVCADDKFETIRCQCTSNACTCEARRPLPQIRKSNTWMSLSTSAGDTDHPRSELVFEQELPFQPITQIDVRVVNLEDRLNVAKESKTLVKTNACKHGGSKSVTASSNPTFSCPLVDGNLESGGGVAEADCRSVCAAANIASNVPKQEHPAGVADPTVVRSSSIQLKPPTIILPLPLPPRACVDLHSI